MLLLGRAERAVKNCHVHLEKAATQHLGFKYTSHTDKDCT